MLRKYYELLRLMRNERKPLEKLKEEQSIKLRHLVRHAYENVPFYFEKFNQAGVHPDDIRGIEDINKIPIITKDDFHASEPDKLVDKRIKNHDMLQVLCTSGSSGKILRFFVDRKYNQLRKAQFLRPYLSNGQGLFDRSIWFRVLVDSSKPFYQKLGLLRDRQLKVNSDIAEQIKIIQQVKPDVMRGYGSAFQLLVAHGQEENIKLHSPRTVFTDSELLSEDLRNRIEQAFDTEVIDVYGSFETENIAYECNHHQGYHMAIDCAVIEFVKNGEHVKSGEVGEVIFTVLDNYTFPFIRYNIGDLASYTDQPCSCGRTLPLMDVSTGRVADYAVTSDGRKVSSTVFLGSLQHLGKYIHEFQVIQEDLNLFTALIVPTSSYHENVGAQIIDDLLGDLPDAAIDIRLVQKIDREKSGKLKVFKSFMKT